MAEPRLVFDTNVVVSALLMPASVPRSALDLGLARGRLLGSATLLGEYRRVLQRPRYDRYILETKRQEFLGEIERLVEWVEVDEAIEACRDVDDNPVLALAVCGRADCLVTGDRDLLTLDPFRGIPILTPRAFLDRFGADDEPS